MKCFTKQETRLLNFYDNYSLIASEAKNEAKSQSTIGKGLEILTPKQLLQRLLIAHAQVKVGLLNEIRQIVYSLYQSKETTKKVYNNIIKSIQS